MNFGITLSNRGVLVGLCSARDLLVLADAVEGCAAIITAAIVVSAWIMLDILDDFADRRMQQFERSLRSATSLGGRQFWAKLENQLDQLADPKSDLPPEKKAKILAQIKVVADRWRPLLLEAASAVEGDAPKPQK
jgi:hypothetical protein